MVNNQNNNIITPTFTKEELWCLNELDEDLLTNMENISEHEPEYVHIFPFCRPDRGDGFYLDIYIYDASNYDFERFLIAPNHRLSEEQEKRFIEYIRSYSLIHTEDDFIDEVGKKIPEFRTHENMNERVFLERSYYISHPSDDAKELLYKIPGFSNSIAYNLEKFENLNPGTNVKQIFGIPLKCLKLFAEGEKYHYILDQWQRNCVIRAYTEFHNFINSQESSISYYQWLYLDDIALAKERGRSGDFGLKINKPLFKYLGDITDEEDYAKVAEYFEMYDKYKNYLGDTRIRTPQDLESEINRAYRIEYFLGEREVYDEGIKDMYQRFQYLEYENDKYMVSIAKDVEDYLMKAAPLNNCLIGYSYPDAVSEGKCVILFVTNGNPKHDFAVEVVIGPDDTFMPGQRRLVQAYGRYNRYLTKAEVIFLKEYCREHLLHFNVTKLLQDYMDDPYDHGIEDELYQMYFNNDYE